mgnify:CR=1 FL=1
MSALLICGGFLIVVSLAAGILEHFTEGEDE